MSEQVLLEDFYPSSMSPDGKTPKMDCSPFIKRLLLRWKACGHLAASFATRNVAEDRALPYKGAALQNGKKYVAIERIS